MTVSTCIETAMANGLGESLAALEEKRLNMARINTRILAGGAGCAAVVSAILFAKHMSGVFLAIAAVLCMIIAGAIVWSRRRKVAVAFKEEIMPVLLKAIGNEFSYSSGGYISEDEFKNAGLFTRPDRYNGKDLVYGRHGRTGIRFSMLHAEEEHETTETDDDGHTTTSTYYTNIFKGLFASADFNKNFGCRTIVKAGKAGFFSNIFGTLVKLEDPRFNQVFTVKSSDQIEARYLLTPALMERLLSLRNKLGVYQASFVDSRLCIAVDGYNYDAFEPDLSRPFSPAQVTGTVGTLLDVIGLVDTLDLNTRIWTKN